MKIKVKLAGNFQKEIEEQMKGLGTKAIPNLIALLSAATPKDTGEAAAGWHQEGNAIVNDVEHIVPLNEGTSEQAPAYFIEQTLLSQKGVRASGIIVRSQ